MKAWELMIGSLVECDGQIISCDVDEIIWVRDHEDHSYKPIVLTEEWLLKFDFVCEELTTRTYWTNYHIKLIKGYKRNGYPFHLVSSIFSTKEIRYVHELQRLYFALFGKELELK